MSPIYETKRDSKSAKIKEDGLNWSLLLAFLMILSPIFLVEFMGASFLLFWLLAPFAGFGNLVGRIQQSSYVSHFNSEYEEINNQYKKIIKNKKLLKDNKIHLVTLNPTLDVAQKRDKLRSSESQFNVPVSLDLVQQDRMARWKILQESVLTLSGIGLWIDNSTMTIEETVSYILKNKEKCIVK